MMLAFIMFTDLRAQRLRQHNGELLQGAWKTKQSDKRPWDMICIVSGFPSKISALQFEHAWQHPFRSRHIQPGDRITKNKNQASTLHKHLGNLRLLLSSRSLCRWPLRFHIFDTEVERVWKQNKYKVAEIPTHVTTLLDIRKPEGLAKDAKTKAGREAREVASDAEPSQSPPKTRGRKKKAQTVSESLEAEAPAELELSRRINIHDGDGLGGIKGLKITTEMYEPYFSYSAHRIENGDVCGICSELLGNENDYNGLATVICSNTDCLETYHTTCLANEFLCQASDPSDKQIHVLPVQGSCTTCEHLLDWGLLIRNSFWRGLGNKDASVEISLTQQHQMVEDNDKVTETGLSELSNVESDVGILSQKSKTSPVRSQNSADAALHKDAANAASRKSRKATATGQMRKRKHETVDDEIVLADSPVDKRQIAQISKETKKDSTKLARDAHKQGLPTKKDGVFRVFGSKGRLLEYIPDSEDDSEEFEIEDLLSDDKDLPKRHQPAARLPLYSRIEVVDISDQSTM
ncbi:hypothetical protein V1520DRAFT_331010 [Lipomyces starkeyi]